MCSAQSTNLEGIDLTQPSYGTSLVEDEQQSPLDLIFDSAIDLSKVVEDALANEHGISADIRIDDRDMPRAKNFYAWCTEKSYLKVEPYAKQLEIGIGLLQEYCPRCSDTKWLRNVPVDASYKQILAKVTLLEHEQCPRCRATKAELISTGELNDYYEMAVCAGQRGGKSAVVAMLSSYLTHQMLKLGNPAQVFGQLPGETLYGTFTALTLDQVTRSLWRPIQKYFIASPWYREYHKLLGHYGAKYGEEIYRNGETFLHYRHRGLYLGIQTPDRRKLRGSTMFMGGIDEIGLFDAMNAGQVKFSAEQIYTSMANSFSNLRGAHAALRAKGINFLPPPMFMNISSPMTKFDKITTLVEKNKKSKDIFVRHYATWEMNPKVTRKSLQGRFDRNFHDAMRDFGAVPPMSTSAFFDNVLDFKPSLDRENVNAFSIQPTTVINPAKKANRSGKVKWHWKDTDVPKILAIDAGSSNNSFAVALGHVDIETPTVDGMGEIIPDNQHRINFHDITADVLHNIIKNQNVKLVVADRWESLKVLHDLEAEFGGEGLEWEQYSCKYTDFENFREDVWNGNVVLPWPEMKAKEINGMGEKTSNYPFNFIGKPVSHFMFQAVTVQDFQGKSVEKGSGLTDDIFRATVLLHAFLSDEEVMQDFIGRTSARRTAPAQGVLVSASQMVNRQGLIPGSRVGAVATKAAFGGMSSGVKVFSRGS